MMAADVNIVNYSGLCTMTGWRAGQFGEGGEIIW